MELDNINDLIKRYVAGESIRKLAMEMGVTHYELGKQFRARGVRIRGKAEATRLFLKRNFPIKEMALRYNAGASLADIAREFSSTLMTIRRALAGHVEFRTVSESLRARHTKSITNLDSLIRRYKSGETLASVSESSGVNQKTLRSKFIAKNVRIRNSIDAGRVEMDIASVKARYLAGESIKAIADSLGIGRGPVAHRLQESGIDLRGTAAAATMIPAAMARASTRQAKLLNISPAEISMTNALRSLSISVEPQKPVGTYNIDLALDGRPIAVEIESGPAFYYPQTIKLRERLEYLINHDWCVVYIVTIRKPIIFPDMAYKIIALLDRSRSDKTVFGQYGVIDRYGQPRATPRYQFDGLARIPGF